MNPHALNVFSYFQISYTKRNEENTTNLSLHYPLTWPLGNGNLKAKSGQRNDDLMD